MPSNTFIVPQLVTREILPFLSNERVFSRNILHTYDKHYDAAGAPKSGARLEIRLPNRFITRSGNQMQVQSLTDSTTALVMGDPIGIDLDVSTMDWTLNIDDWRNRYGQPMAAQVANEIDRVFLLQALNSYFTVGTYGTTPNTLQVMMDAKTALDNVGVKDDGNIHALLNPAANGGILPALATYYNPKNTISEQYRKGVLIDMLGLILNKTQNLPVLKCGTRTAPGSATLSATSSQGDTTLALTSVDSTGTILAGEVFEVGDATHPLNAVNYQTRNPIPNPRTKAYGTAQFVCTANCQASGGNVTVPVAPVINGPVAGAKVQYQTFDSLPASGATVTFLGTASASYPISIVYHRDAFAAAFAKLWIPPGESWNDTFEGMNMRYWRQGDIINNAAFDRLDVLAACILALSERCVRIIG